MLSAIASTALSFVSTALLKSSATSKTSTSATGATAGGTMVTTSQASAARPIIYGRTRVGGVYGLVTVSALNRTLDLVILVAGHKIAGFDEIWADNRHLAFDGRDWLGLGAGNIVGEIDGYGRWMQSDYAGLVKMQIHLGEDDQEADRQLMHDISGVWTVTDRLRGIAYIVAQLDWKSTVFKSGTPNITTTVRGKDDVYDPRDGSTGWSENPALCLANYLCDSLYGLGADYATEIDEAALIAAANACDELVPLTGGGTEKRYTISAAIGSDVQPQEIIGKILGCMHGKLVYNGERWRILAGVWQEPTVSLDDSILRKGARVQTLTSRRDLFNSVAGTYRGPATQWQTGDFPKVKSDAYIAKDGQEIVRNIELPFTPTASMAQRIAKIDLLKSRQQIVATMPCTLAAWQAQAGDTLRWTSPRYGWVNKPFEVSKVTFAIEDGPGGPVIGIDLELQETDPSIYDWTTDEESLVDPAPNTNFPNVVPLPPSTLTALEGRYVTRGGAGVKAKVTLAWEASPDAFVVSGGGYRPAWKPADSDVWRELGTTSELSADVLDLAPGIYDFRVVAVNWAGNDSVALTRQDYIAGLSAPPSAPANFTVEALDSFALARCDISIDDDVRLGGSIVFKHSAATSGATWDTALTLCDPQPANAGAWALPLKAGTYLAKYYDAQGIPSATAASFVQSQSSVLTFTPLAGGTSVQAPGFAGTKTNCFVDTGLLKLASPTLVSEMPLISTVTPTIGTYGGVAAAGTYDFDAVMDLGSVKRCRLTNTVTAQVINVFDNIAGRTTTVSAWPSISGVTGDEADSWLEVSFTPDDPAGTPTWSDWQRLDAASFAARAFRFRRQLERNDSNFSIAISQDDVVAEGI